MAVMNLKDHLASLDHAKEANLAAASGATVGHMRNVASGFRAASPVLASAIERATDGAVTRRDLRPADWHLIWPELTAPTRTEAQEPAITQEAA